MVEGFHFLLALHYTLFELVYPRVVLVHLRVLPVLLYLLQLLLDVLQSLHELLLLTVQLLRQLCLSLLDDSHGLTDCVFDVLGPYLQMPEAVVDPLVNAVEILLEYLEVSGDGVDLILEFLHGSVVLADEFVQLLQLLLIEEARFLGHEFLLPVLVVLLYGLDALTAYFEDLLQYLVKDFDRLGDKCLLGHFSPDLEEPTVDLVDGQFLDGLFGVVNFCQLAFDLVPVQEGYGDAALGGREEFLEDV